MTERDLVKLVRTTVPKKLAVRLLSLSAAERSQSIGEYHQQKGAKPESRDGIVATLDGEYDKEEQRIVLSFKAKVEIPENWVETVWFAILNGPNQDSPSLSCAWVNAETAAEGNEMSGGTFYTVANPGELQATVTLFLSVIPHSGDSAVFTKQIQTAPAT